MRKNFWYRAGPLGAVGALLLTVSGCGDTTTTTQDMGGGDTPITMPDMVQPPDLTGVMQDLTAPPPDLIMPGGPKVTANPATTSGGGTMFTHPFDAVPTSDGKTFYFTALDPTSKDDPGKATSVGVYSVAAGGGAPTAVSVGSPLLSPFGLAISSDDKTLFIADSVAGGVFDDPTKPDAPGGIYSVAATGGKATLLTGTDGYMPRGVQVVGADLYFTGNDKSTGAPGVFKISVNGGAATPVLAGSPLNDPGGIVVLKNGDIYVADGIGSGKSKKTMAVTISNFANVIKVSGGKGTQLVGGLPVGFPAGISTNMKEDWLLVSGQDVSTGESVVFTVNIATGKYASFNKGIEGSLDSGGLHRANGTDTFAWCGVTAGNGGTVFQVTLK